MLCLGRQNKKSREARSPLDDAKVIIEAARGTLR